MSDFGNSHSLAGCLSDTELEQLACSRGADCHCTGATCRLVRELRAHRAQLLSEGEQKALRWLRDQLSAERPYHTGAWNAQRGDVAIAGLDKVLA